ncbi:unnamed protein product [Calypogeia fissa]
MVVQGIYNITNKFLKLAEYLDQLPADSLSDPKRKLLTAFEKLVVAVQKKLRDALIAPDTLTGLEHFAEDLRVSLEFLSDNAYNYCYELFNLCPQCETKEGVRLEDDLNGAIGKIVEKL